MWLSQTWPKTNSLLMGLGDGLGMDVSRPIPTRCFYLNVCIFLFSRNVNRPTFLSLSFASAILHCLRSCLYCCLGCAYFMWSLFWVATFRLITSVCNISWFVELLWLIIFIIRMLGLNIVFVIEIMFGNNDWLSDLR